MAQLPPLKYAFGTGDVNAITTSTAVAPSLVVSRFHHVKEKLLPAIFVFSRESIVHFFDLQHYFVNKK